MKHDGFFVVKPPITFPCLITGIILNQHFEVLLPQETPNKKFGPLTLDKKLFAGTYIPYIVVTKHQGHTAGGNYFHVSKATIKDVLFDVMEVSNSRQDTFTASTIRKRNVDRLIKMLIKEKDVEDEEKANNQEKEEEQFASDEKDGSSRSSSEEEESIFED